MERRFSDRDREERERDDWRSHGRTRYDQHDHERERHRLEDDYVSRRGGRSREDEGGMGRYDRYDRGFEETPMHGRYQYGPEEDRSQWTGRERINDRSESHRPGGPRREEPYRGPSRRDDYAMYREGNYAGYDTWRGHNNYQNHNGPSAMGTARRAGWERRGFEHPDERRRDGERDEGWRSQRYGDYDRGEGDWRERMDTAGSWRGRPHESNREDLSRQRSRDIEDDRFARGRTESERERGSGRDNSGMWRRFDEWGDTSYGARRDSGVGFRRAPHGGGSFWESPDADREDE
jgi:hypothetical protein